MIPWPKPTYQDTFGNILNADHSMFRPAGGHAPSVPVCAPEPAHEQTTQPTETKPMSLTPDEQAHMAQMMDSATKAECGPPETPTSEGVARIAAERRRQMAVEGFDPSHDDEHDEEAIAWAAVCYAAPDRVYRSEEYPQAFHFVDPWPWSDEWDKRVPRGLGVDMAAHRIRCLEKAGALIAAEIDRLLRLQASEKSPSPGDQADV